MIRKCLFPAAGCGTLSACYQGDAQGNAANCQQAADPVCREAREAGLPHMAIVTGQACPGGPFRYQL